MELVNLLQAEDSTGRILIARVMHGGAADRSGLIAVGDEVSVVFMLVLTMMVMVVMTMMKLSLGVNLMGEAMKVQSQMVSNLLEMAQTHHSSDILSKEH